jgi:hypothetical protein
MAAYDSANPRTALFNHLSNTPGAQEADADASVRHRQSADVVGFSFRRNARHVRAPLYTRPKPWYPSPLLSGDQDCVRMARNTTTIRRYLIAQRAVNLSPDGLPGLKAHLHSNQGQIPDHTRLPAVFESQRRVSPWRDGRITRFNLLRNRYEVERRRLLARRIRHASLYQLCDRRSPSSIVAIRVRHR